MARKPRRRGRCSYCGGRGLELPARGLCWTCYHKASVRRCFATEIPYEPWSKRERAQLEVMRGRGMTAAEIGRELRRTRHSVRWAMRRNNGH